MIKVKNREELKIMRKCSFISGLLALFMGIVSSCNISPVNPFEQNLPAVINLSISTPAPAMVDTRATDLQETVISDLTLFFYRKDNYLDRPKAVISLTSAQLSQVQELSSTNYVYSITIEDSELTSGNYYLYAIANSGSSNFGSVNIESLKTLSLVQLKNTILTKNNNLIDMIENALLLTGVYGRADGSLTLVPGVNNLSERVHLRRITAKVGFEIATAPGVQFEPVSYDVYNLPANCTLFERSGWTDKNNSTDNVNGTFSSLVLPQEQNKEHFNLTDRDLVGMNAFTFYMLENAQQPVSTVTEYRYREVHISPFDQSFANAPAKGTYVVIKGRYTGPDNGLEGQTTGTVSGNVSFTIHLGDFSNASGSLNNYTIRRNARYNYKINVNGVNSILVEAIDRDGDYQAFDGGAEGNIYTVSNNTTNINLDSHYETVMVKMPKFSPNAYTIRSITPKENVTYTTTEGGALPGDVQWVKFMKPASATQLKAFPGANSSQLTDIYGLIDDINSGAQTYYLETEDNYYAIAFVDEYYYNDLTLREFVNVADRELTLASGIAVSADGLSTYALTPIFSLTQQSIKTMYNLDINDPSYNPFGIEILEEFGPVTWNGKLSVSGTSADEAVTATNESNVDGRHNFRRNFTSSSKWSTYVNYSNAGHFDNSTFVADGSMKSNYSAAKWQCISRNRDENGNGTIDADEIKWYLPAIEQCLTIWYGYPSLGGDARLNIDYQGYFSSTAGSTGTSSSTNRKRVWYIDEGASFGSYVGAHDWLFGSGGHSNPSYKLGVRCARTLVNSSAEPTESSSYDEQTRVISLSKLGSASVRVSGSVTGEYDRHFRNEAPDQLPEMFEVAKNFLQVGDKTQFNYAEATAGNMCRDYYAQDGETAGANTGWRIPNEREFGLMVKHLPFEEMDETIARTIYYRRYDANPVNAAYLYEGHMITCNVQYKEGSTGTKKIRCIRDVSQGSMK